MLSCSACGAANPDGQNFCGECGVRLGEVAALREERKIVTVLFVDLVGFTGRAEQLDPEDVRAMLSPYYATLRREIERYGGSIEKFIGDAVMAVFGAPAAHEDDPERAVRAALAVRSAIAKLNDEDGLGLAIRVGVNTGEALVALGARAIEGEGMVAGDVVNTAARLEAAAPVGGILVGEVTYRATQAAIEYREAAPVDAKGKQRPALVWEAIDVRSRLGIDVDERPAGRLVGRTRELGMLADSLARSRADGTSQLVTLVGVPGIGKSRLVAELLGIVDGSPDLYRWRQGRSLPYGETQTFRALGEIVKAQAGILESDSADAARTKLTRAVVNVLPSSHDREWVEPLLAPLIGVSTASSATDRGLEAFAAWRRFLEALAEQRPLVLVFEDLHWADEGLLDFVDHLAEWVTTVPMLIVATARPELLERRPEWGGGKQNATTTSLAPLTEVEASQQLAQLLEQALLPAEVQAEVLGRSSGNPLYTEEYVHMLQDRGFLVQDEGGWRLTSDEDLPLPENVQGMIAARLDALPAREKELVQDAAVVGKVFWPSALAALGPGDQELALHALTRKEFIRRDRGSAIANDTQYAFLHALVRDVAYAQIPRSLRAAKHRAAADWLESLSPDRTSDRSEMLAHHLGAASDLAEATGHDVAGLRPRLRAALVDASRHAEALFSWRAARERARAALTLSDPTDASDASDLALRIAWASFCLGEYDTDAAARARDLSLVSGDAGAAATAEVLRAQMHWYRGEGETARSADSAAAALVADLPSSPAKAWVLAQTARREVISAGDLPAGEQLAREALELAEAVGRLDLAAHALNTIGLSRATAGDAEGIVYLERSIEVAAQASAVVDVVGGINNLANMLWSFGRLGEASEQLRRHRAECERFGLDAFLVWGEAEATLDAYLRGDYSEMIVLAERFVAAHGQELHHQIALQLNAAAHGYAVTGRSEEAIALTDRGLPAARQTEAIESEAYALMVRAHVLRLDGQATEAASLIAELLDGPHYLGYFHWLAPLALLVVESGQSDDYLRALEPFPRSSVWRDAAVAAADGDLLGAAATYDRIGSTFVAAWARLLAAEAGDASELGVATAFFADLGASPYLARCERLAAASA